MPDVICRIGVIADDLTGACDAGVQFSKAGLNTTVLLESDAITWVVSRCDVVVVNTDSRNDHPMNAYDVASKAAQLLTDSGVPRLYKKVDSTLRGNIGAEIDGVMDASGVDMCILAPAFPAGGRTTVSGRQLVNGELLEKSEVAEDPLAPTDLSYIPDIVARQSSQRVTHISLEEVRRGERFLADRFAALCCTEHWHQIVVVDAKEQEDLRLIARAAESAGVSFVTAGSAGLAAELPSAFGLTASHDSASCAKSPGGILIVNGSSTMTSAEQVSVASEAPGVEKLDVDVDHDALLSDEAYAAMIANLSKAVCSKLRDGNDVIVSVVRSETVSGGREIASRLKGLLSGIARAAVLSDLVNGIVVTGGDTSGAVLRTLCALGLKVKDEICPGIPLNIIVGGFADGMPVVTKAGGFGASDALLVAIRALRRGGCGDASQFNCVEVHS